MTDERRGSDRIQSLLVLVVDDSVTIRRLLATRLEAAGYRVGQAENGRAAIDGCRVEVPDLMLLDVDMPELDGLATLREMKADDGLRDIPVLFLTAHSHGAEVAAGLELGAQDYLRKPCEPAELLARVSTALRMDQMQKQLQRQAAELDALSNTDPLTGLGNRRRFEQEIPSLATSGEGGSVGFLLLDIDHFKQINDTHGHAIGDVVLRILAERLLGIVGPDKSVFRWGGEEFVVLAPGLDSAGIAGLAEEIRLAISVPSFAIGTQPLLAVSVSIGCVCAPATRWSDALAAADVAMYEAKTSGRNAVRSGALSA